MQDVESENLKKGDPIYQGIDASKLIPLLTAALQETIVKIETLETKVAALETSWIYSRLLVYYSNTISI